MGQILDSRTSRNFRVTRNLGQFTPDLYRAIVKYKTTYYSFQLPVFLGMYMVGQGNFKQFSYNFNFKILKVFCLQAGVEDEEKSKQISEILFDMGNYFQIQVI